MQAPPVLYKNGCSERIRAGFQEGSVSVRAVTKRLTLDWRASATTNSMQAPQDPTIIDMVKNAVDGNVWQRATQSFTLRFEPTACTVVDGSRIVVCGISSTGRTVIELWLLSWPLVMPQPVTSVGTGLTSVSITLPSIGATQQLYSADVQGKRFVRNITPLRRASGPATEALVQFFDSNDLYSLSLGSGTLTLLATATGGPLGPIGVLVHHCQNNIAFGDRPEYGYSYIFGNGLSSPFALASPAQYPTLILLDSDRDGDVDFKQELVDSDYLAQGWGLATNFNLWWRP